MTVRKRLIDTAAQLKFSELVSHSCLLGIKGSLNEMVESFNNNLVNILNIVALLKVKKRSHSRPSRELKRSYRISERKWRKSGRVIHYNKYKGKIAS